jgi:hypothetical protein
MSDREQSARRGRRHPATRGLGSRWPAAQVDGDGRMRLDKMGVLRPCRGHRKKDLHRKSSGRDMRHVQGARCGRSAPRATVWVVRGARGCDGSTPPARLQLPCRPSPGSGRWRVAPPNPPPAGAASTRGTRPLSPLPLLLPAYDPPIILRDNMSGRGYYATGLDSGDEEFGEGSRRTCWTPEVR